MRILITDDHPVVRKGLRQLLEDDIQGRFNSIDEAANSKELLEKITMSTYDIILLDISMPGRNGLDLIPDIKKLSPRTSILMLSIYLEDQYAIRAFKLGAAGYLTKDTAPLELMSAIFQVASGKRYITPALAEKITFGIIDAREINPHDVLSVRELEVMSLLATGSKISDIAAELSLSPKTISTYRERIIEKLKLKTTADIIRYAIREGLV